MRKFLLTHDIGHLDHPKVEAIRRTMENSPEFIVMKVWFSTGTGKMVTEVEAESEEAATAAFKRLELPAYQALEATELVMRARVIPVVHT